MEPLELVEPLEAAAPVDPVVLVQAEARRQVQELEVAVAEPHRGLVGVAVAVSRLVLPDDAVPATVAVGVAAVQRDHRGIGFVEVVELLVLAPADDVSVRELAIEQDAVLEEALGGPGRLPVLVDARQVVVPASDHVVPPRAVASVTVVVPAADGSHHGGAVVQRGRGGRDRRGRQYEETSVDAKP